MRISHFVVGSCSAFAVSIFVFLLVAGPAPAAPAPNPAQLAITTNFKLWERGSEVKTLRTLLAKHGVLDPSKVDDPKYDLELMEAVRAFQRGAGLKPTGIPRRETLLAINKAARGAPSTPPAAAIPTAESAKPLLSEGTRKIEPIASTPAAPLPRARPQGGPTVATTASAAPTAPTTATDGASPMLHATSLRQTTEAIARYRAIVAAGGWGALTGLARFEVGHAQGMILPLRARLATEGYLTREQVANTTYDDVLAAALRRYQRNHGLEERDALDRLTLAALNIPASTRLSQLESTFARLTQRLAGLDLAKEPYVLLNIPARMVEFVNNGQVVSSRLAIVGKPATRSPELVGFIRSVTLNPTWTVPYSIVRKEIVPALRRNLKYLDRHGMRVERDGVAVDHTTVDWKNQANLVVQRPGPRNSLGNLRIDMPNPYKVYLHDTPQQRLFDSATRYYSHGCARVQDVVGFAEILLRQTDPALTKKAMTAEINEHDGGWQPGRTIKLKRPIRVIWVYMTAWVSEDGSIAFRKDVYKRDKPAVFGLPPSREMSGNQRPVATR